MPPALGAPKYIPSSELTTPKAYLDQLVYGSAGEPVPAAAPVATENSAPVPAPSGDPYGGYYQSQAAPVESYATEPVGGNDTLGPMSVQGGPYQVQDPAYAPPTNQVQSDPSWDRAVGPANDPYGAYGSVQLMPSTGADPYAGATTLPRTITPAPPTDAPWDMSRYPGLNDPNYARKAWRGDNQPLVFQLPGTGEGTAAPLALGDDRFAQGDTRTAEEKRKGLYPPLTLGRGSSPTGYGSAFSNDQVRQGTFFPQLAQRQTIQEPASDPYAHHQAGASDIRTYPAQQPGRGTPDPYAAYSSEASDIRRLPGQQPATDWKENAASWLLDEPEWWPNVGGWGGAIKAAWDEPIPGTETLDAGDILPTVTRMITPGMDPTVANAVRAAQDEVGQQVPAGMQGGWGSLVKGFRTSASIAQPGVGNERQPDSARSTGPRNAVWPTSTRGWLESRREGASPSQNGSLTKDPYATGGTSSGAQTTPPVVNDGDVSRNRAAKLLTPDLQFVTSERTSDAWTGGTGSQVLRVIHGDDANRVVTDAIVTPDSMNAAITSGLVPWVMNNEEFDILVEQGVLPESARGQMTTIPVLMPKAWADLLPQTEGDTLTDVQAVDPYTAPATDTSSDSGSGWVDYGNDGGGGGYRRRSYSSGGGGGGYSRSYGGGGGYSGGGGGGDWGGGGFDMSWLPEGFGGEDGFMSGSFDSPIFARYFDVLSRHMGEERAMSLLQGMRGMKRGFKRSKRTRSRSMPNGRTLTTKGPRQSSVNEGLSVPSNERVRKDVGKQIRKSTKDKEA